MTSYINKSMKNNSSNSDIVIVDDHEKGTTTLPLSSSSSSPMSLKRIIVGVFVLLSLCGFAAILLTTTTGGTIIQEEEKEQQQGQGRHRSLASLGGNVNDVNADGSSNNNNSNNIPSGNSACTRSNPDCTRSPISVPEPTPVPVPEPTPSPIITETLPPPTPEDVCADKDNFRWKGKESRDCQWLRRKKDNKLRKLCTRSGKVDGEKLRLYEWCPTTCATVDLGACTE